VLVESYWSVATTFPFSSVIKGFVKKVVGRIKVVNIVSSSSSV
jgi:hypothetical protein